ncbi:hypothetical protein [Herbaspirillum sp. alder98]|uniref:hypothetical protein n=1 Tax=Herbaspirillum sp. alder98 TaxID=2913096 RepID=UPI001CD8A2CF|nr:hypothetical protein [Herbaspirillum sp. alder98]MCA1325610.1 hypothetical protein [Herbaspirillum sp. alder98]
MEQKFTRAPLNHDSRSACQNKERSASGRSALTAIASSTDSARLQAAPATRYWLAGAMQRPTRLENEYMTCDLPHCPKANGNRTRSNQEKQK